MRYLIISEQSRLTVQAFAKGFLSAFGHSPTLAVRALAGEVEFDADSLDASSVRLSILAESLTVIDSLSDSDRRDIERKTREEVLAVARFPEIFFQTASVKTQRTAEGYYRVLLNGELSLRGLTSPQIVEANVMMVQNCLRTRGKTTLRQSDYRIEPVSALGGAIKLKDELEIAFDIYACRPS
jgi:polyisoprenoid-binding protein YceI